MAFEKGVIDHPISDFGAVGLDNLCELLRGCARLDQRLPRARDLAVEGRQRRPCLLQLLSLEAETGPSLPGRLDQGSIVGRPDTPSSKPENPDQKARSYSPMIRQRSFSVSDAGGSYRAIGLSPCEQRLSLGPPAQKPCEESFMFCNLAVDACEFDAAGAQRFEPIKAIIDLPLQRQKTVTGFAPAALCFLR
jgi:hypothetical protein